MIWFFLGAAIAIVLGWMALTNSGAEWAKDKYAWWNPYDFSKGFVDGNAMHELERREHEGALERARWDKEVNAKIEADVAAAAKAIKNKAFQDARLKELRDSINTPAPQKPVMFPGSKATKSKRAIEGADKQDPGWIPTIVGTVVAGVGPGPKHLRGKKE